MTLEPLSRDEQARYYEETLGAGPSASRRRASSDLDAFETYLDGMLRPGGPIEVGDLARDLAGSILHPPLGPAVTAAGFPFDRLAGLADAIPGRAYGWLFWPAIGLLPNAFAMAMASRGACASGSWPAGSSQRGLSGGPCHRPSARCPRRCAPIGGSGRGSRCSTPDRRPLPPRAGDPGPRRSVQAEPRP